MIWITVNRAVFTRTFSITGVLEAIVFGLHDDGTARLML